MNTIFGWTIRRRKLVAMTMAIAMGVSLYVPVKGVKVGATTSVEEESVPENNDNVSTANVEQSATPQPTETPVNTLVVKRKKCTYPKKLYEGQSFSLKGTLKSNHEMKQVVASIVSEEGEEECKVTKRTDGTTFQLKKVDSKMVFSKLDAGKYTYEISVTDEYGNEKRALKKKFQVKESKYMWPVQGGVLGDTFRCKCSSHHGKHYGIDVKGVSKGTKIHAVREGEVVYAQYHGGSSKGSFGKLVVLYHGNGIYSYYAHCNSFRCKVGEKVEKGDVIATVGNSGRSYGTHLHLELRKGPDFNGKYNNYKLLDKYTYKQFNPLKKNYLKYVR